MRGSICKRGRTYSIVLDVGRHPVTGKRKQQWVSGFKTKKEAEAELARLITDVERGTIIDPKKITLGEYLRQWLETHKPNLAPSTYRTYHMMIEKHLIPTLGNTPLTKLQPMNVQAFLTQEMEKGRKDNKKTVGKSLSPATIQYTYRVLHHALKQAVEWHMLSRNPADSVKPPRPQKKDLTVLTEGEVNRLLEALKGGYLYLPSFLGIYTGMRMGEILGLTWQDVDLKRGIVQVRQANCQRRAAEPEFRAPKTAKSRRSIDITPSVVKALKEHRKQQAEWRLKAGSAWQSYDLVCCLEDGRPINPPSLSSHFRTMASDLGVKITFHGLRHTHASLLLKAGVPAKVVSERLGHSTIAMTMDTYSHLMPGMQRDAADRLEKMLSKSAR